MIPYYIYGLLNPITNQYFYVGATSQELRIRLNGHMSSTDKNEQKVAVIQGILNYDERPKIVLLETTYDIDKCSDMELSWMNKLKFEGHPLINKSFKKAGRLPSTTPKVQINLYIEEDKIELLGGVDRLRKLLYYFTDNYNPDKPLKEYYTEFEAIEKLED